MHCFSVSSVSCVTERLSGCKDTDLYWIRANYYLKKDYSTVAFSIILIAPLHVSSYCTHPDINAIPTSIICPAPIPLLRKWLVARPF